MKGKVWLLAVLLGWTALAFAPAAVSPQIVQAQTPVTTVTGTPEGPTILVPDRANVRMCPHVNCDLIGVLIAGQEVPAIGRTSGGDWIQIIYQGVPGNVAWVYVGNVIVDQGQDLLPVVEPPSTPTPRITATIDPTLAAQFNFGAPIATRLPTFTPASAVIQPTFEPVGEDGGVGFPPILAIITFFVVGVFGMVISVLRGSSTRL